MKPFVLVLALIASFFIAVGQTYHSFVDTGKVWSTYHYYCKKGGNPFSEFTKFDKDTLIDGKLYKFIWSSSDTNMTTWTPSGFIREDTQKRVFYRNSYSDWETAIYDFGASAGDTIELRENPYDPFLYTVDSIDWVTMLDGNQRQRFYLTSIDFSPCNEIWIEGMGCTKGVLQGATCGMTGDNPSLICFTENDTLLYFNPDFEQCYVITGIDDPAQPQTEISLYPNPAREYLTIRIKKPGTGKMKFKLADLSGKEIFTIPVVHAETSVNLKHLEITPGFYLYHVFLSATCIKTGTLMILD